MRWILVAVGCLSFSIYLTIYNWKQNNPFTCCTITEQQSALIDKYIRLRAEWRAEQKKQFWEDMPATGTIEDRRVDQEH